MPQSQFGGPGPGGSFDHFDVVSFPIPVGAASVDVQLYYQSTSWEYVQFLWKQNAGLDPFLGNEGVNFLDAGVALFTPDPVVGESISWVLVGHNADFEGSYGATPAGERPANSGAAGSCFRPQNPALACE